MPVRRTTPAVPPLQPLGDKVGDEQPPSPVADSTTNFEGRQTSYESRVENPDDPWRNQSIESILSQPATEPPMASPGVRSSEPIPPPAFAATLNQRANAAAAAAAAGVAFGFEHEVRFELQRINYKLDLVLGNRKGLMRPRSSSVDTYPLVATNKGFGSSRPSNNNDIRRIVEDGDIESTGPRVKSFFAEMLMAQPPASKLWERASANGDTDAPSKESSVMELQNAVVFGSTAMTMGEPTRQLSTETDQSLTTTTVEHRMEVIREKQMRMTDILRHHQRHTIFPFLDDVWQFIEYYDSSQGARIFNRVMPLFIMSSAAFTLSQTLDDPPFSPVASAVVETAIDSFYLMLLLIRFISCPNQRAFLHNAFNLIDIATVAPLFVRFSIGFVLPSGPAYDPKHAFLLYWTPMIRLLKTMRRYEKLHLLFRAFQKALEAAPVLLYMGACLALFFSIVIHLVEWRDNPQMKTLPETFWFTCVTMCTVGYGDITPQTWEGKVITSILMFNSMLFMAVPVGIIGNTFNQTWSERDRLMMTKKTRDRLKQWGYAASDIPTLFACSDTNDDGELNFSEFRLLIKKLQLGLSDERIYQLFNSFDTNSSGTIEDKEFVKALFPSAYHEIYEQGFWSVGIVS